MTGPAEPSLLDRVLAGLEDDFALLHRPESGRADTLEVLVGKVSRPASLTEIPLPGPDPGGGHQMLVLVPYRQVTERGFAAPDDGTPLLAMTVTGRQRTGLADGLARLPQERTTVQNGRFDVSDEDYAETVRRIVKDEIGTGEGANFVIKRSFTGQVEEWSPRHALALFRRLLEREQGAYWTFLVRIGGRTLVGATPECHVTLRAGTAAMNPISGTYRYPATGPTLAGVTAFLADRKEADELYMVVDEELKMMARICDDGGRVVGPRLKEMTRLAHTEYFIEGRSTRDVREILRETMFAPTVTGSPLESACRVIRRYEPEGRGYYGGVAALVGSDENGDRTLDSAILIRTADIAPDGRLRIGVGATLVRHSDPESEVAETQAKAAGLLGALESGQGFADHPTVRAALERRNDDISDFWLGRAVPEGSGSATDLAGRRVLVVDAEDTFTAMIAQQLRWLRLDVTVARFDEPYAADDYDLVVMGPGPGDPRAVDEPRIAHLRAAVGQLLAERRPFLAVCLSHQTLCLRLGLDLRRRPEPNQGVQREIDLFGRRERVGFYNTFAAHSDQDKIDVVGVGPVEACRDRETGEVHALRGPHFASMQFHSESVLTVDGPRVLAEAIREALA